MWLFCCCCSVANSCLTLWPHGLQQASFLCPPLSPGVCSNWGLLSQWWHTTISSSVVPFSSCLSFFLPSISPSIRVFSNKSALHIRWPKYWSFSISPFNEYSGLISFRIDWFDLLAVQGLSRVFSNTTQKHQFFSAQPSLWSNSHICTWLLEKLYGYLSAKWCLLLFNMLSRFVIAFLHRSKRLLISWLQSPSTVILEPRIIKSVTASTFSPSIWHEVMGSDATNFIFWMLSFKPTSYFHSKFLSGWPPGISTMFGTLPRSPFSRHWEKCCGLGPFWRAVIPHSGWLCAVLLSLKALLPVALAWADLRAPGPCSFSDILWKCNKCTSNLCRYNPHHWHVWPWLWHHQEETLGTPMTIHSTALSQQRRSFPEKSQLELTVSKRKSTPRHLRERRTDREFRYLTRHFAQYWGIRN